MFDKVFILYAKLKKDEIDTSYRVENAIVSKTHLNANATKLAVIFPPWHGVRFVTNILAKRLIKRGWSVLLYEFNPQILMPSEDRVLRSFEYIQKSVASDLTMLKAKHNYTSIRLIGLSLGGVALAMTAALFHDFQDAVFVVAGDDLALCMWYGQRTYNLRKSFEKEDTHIRKLDHDWQELSPKNYTTAFAYKHVKMILSRTDTIIPASHQEKFRRAIKKADSDVTFRYSFLGHYLSVVKYCLMGV